MALLASTAPLLLAVSGLAGAALVGRDLVAITQGSGQGSINETLLQKLAPFGASAEMLAPTLVRNQPVFVRGVDPVAFFRLEGWPGVAAFDLPFSAYAGGRLAGRLGLSVGDRATLPGSTVPGFAEVQVEYVFTTDGSRDDELLVSFPVGRALSGLLPGYFHVIRTHASDLDLILDSLRSSHASVHVSSPGLPTIDINSAPAADERIANLALRIGIEGVGTNYVSQIIGQAENSVLTVVLGLGAMVVLLVALSSYAVHARILADMRATFGTLRALGAPPWWIVARLARDATIVAGVATAVGTFAGFGISLALGTYGGFVVFGYLVRPELTPFLLTIVIVVAFVLLLTTALLAVRPFLQGPPREVFVESRSNVRLETVLE